MHVFKLYFYEKEWYLYLKKWDIKTRWLFLRMAEIAFPRTYTWNFPGEDAPGPIYWGAAFGGRISSNPLS